MRFRFGRRGRLAVLVALALGVTAGGIAYAAIPDSNGVIHGCYQMSSGSLRVVGSNPTVGGGNCKAGEKTLDWNQRGPKGPTGATGPSGPRGATGPAGSGATSFTASLPNAPNGGPDVDHTLLTLDNGIAIKGQCTGSDTAQSADVQVTLASASNQLEASGTYNEGNDVFAARADGPFNNSRLDARHYTSVDFDVVGRGTSDGSFAHIDVHGIASIPSCLFWGMIIPSQLTGP